jgi:paraquat-inducible protein A
MIHVMSKEIACHGCDLLVDVLELENGESARCPRCRCFLTRRRDDMYERVLAYSVSALILLVLANSYSFLSFSASGLESVITLAQTPGTLWQYGMPGVAAIVGAFIIVIPAIVLLLMLVLCIPLQLGHYHPWLVTVARGIFLAQNWAMVEVFIIGVIVSLVKIMAMATVVLGISFWAYTGFAICFTLAVASLDRYQCWERIEALGESRVHA